MKDLLMDLIVEYNRERKLEAIARDEKNELEKRVHSHTAFTLSIVIEKVLNKANISLEKITRVRETFEYFNKVDFENKRISVDQVYLPDDFIFSQR